MARNERPQPIVRLHDGPLQLVEDFLYPSAPPRSLHQPNPNLQRHDADHSKPADTLNASKLLMLPTELKDRIFAHVFASIGPDSRTIKVYKLSSEHSLSTSRFSTDHTVFEFPQCFAQLFVCQQYLTDALPHAMRTIGLEIHDYALDDVIALALDVSPLFATVMAPIFEESRSMTILTGRRGQPLVRGGLGRCIDAFSRLQAVTIDRATDAHFLVGRDRHGRHTSGFIRSSLHQSAVMACTYFGLDEQQAEDMFARDHWPANLRERFGLWLKRDQRFAEAEKLEMALRVSGSKCEVKYETGIRCGDRARPWSGRCNGVMEVRVVVVVGTGEMRCDGVRKMTGDYPGW